MARTYNVTSTINSTLIQYKAFNRETEEVETRVAELKLDSAEITDTMYKAIRNKVDIECAKIMHVAEVSALYGMTEDTFFKISWKLESTDSRRDLITRTTKTVMAKVQYFDANEPTKGLQFKGVAMGNGFDKLADDKKLFLARKKIEGNGIAVVNVADCYAVEELRGTTKEKFIAHAVPLNPETRQPYETEDDTEVTKG